MGKLYLVGPLGDSWPDVPLRALRVLQASALIVGRNIDPVREWLRQGDIDAPLIDICASEAIPLLSDTLRCSDVAWLVRTLDDLSGPVRELLSKLVEQGIEPLSVPGPSDAIAGLVVSGLPADSLTFLGLLPADSAKRRSLLNAVAHEPRTLVCEVDAEYLPEIVRDLLACLGDRRVTLHGVRETWRGQIGQVESWPDGERLTVVIEGAGRGVAWPMDQVRDEVHKLLAAGAPPREVAREVARRSGWPRREVYRLTVSARKES
jgi:16S rRNA (cytidine1402-2'-O)-methyltransferase